MKPILYIVIPCYNEEEVLASTYVTFSSKLNELIAEGQINEESRLLYVDDGSRDKTWKIIQDFAGKDGHVKGISLSRNRGHQNALLAGLMEAKDHCHITVSIDCDGQDDINAIDDMLREYSSGSEIVYGVRRDRKKDTVFKRTTAQGYYRFLSFLGVEVVYNHADFRLVSARALKAFADFHEVNLFLRGMFPLVGFKSSCVYYTRNERVAGKTHYPLRKMLGLAMEGVTSLSVKPIRMITIQGFVIAMLSFIGVIWSVVESIIGDTVPGWASTTCIICFIAGIQLISLGVIGEYIGKIYLEVKGRPRYIISDRTGDEKPVKTEDEIQ